MKEFLLTDNDFKAISSQVYDACGIVLAEHKREMVYSRLARRIRYHNLNSFKQYLDFIEKHKELEFSEFINAITTNLTSFNREPHHFTYLKNNIAPQLKHSNAQQKRVRIWSAGCSTGEEAYSIAMTLDGLFPTDWDVKILATDLDSNVLAKARHGTYTTVNVTGLEQSQLKRWFLKSHDRQCYKVKPELQKNIYFKRLNLLQDWPMNGPFDVIFCRNVVIYFDKPTKDQLFKRFYNLLTASGYLFLGHSESLGKDHQNLNNLGQTIYQRGGP